MNIFRNRKIRIRVAGIVTNYRKEILFIRQSKKNHSYWLLPGGGIEKGESALGALKRELKEELGLIIKKAEFLLLNESIGPKGERHIIQLVYKVDVANNYPILNLKEKSILEFKYFSKKDMKDIEIRPDIKNYLLKGKFSKSVSIESKWI
ncbi:MAG: NUDIX hydrolase [Leptospiraceae bacterium]|nr:NUDIX hydrolase [Leptospiraceae bacterium]MCK6380684.1 NUDIX hydrolase [Leptospiraceae bacterium]NUM42628.1 NUDIX hydrolase [Leptospiraceae bacterium]